MNNPEAWALGNGTNVSVTALLQNHVFRGFYPSEAIAEVPTFAQTLLTSQLAIQRQLFTGITGGQYNGLVKNGNDVQILSGELSVSTVVEADISLGDGIIIHKIDRTLSFGPPFQLFLARAGYIDFDSATAISKYNRSLSEFSADEDEGVAELTDLTIFIPNDAAFEDIASVISNADVATVNEVVGYHILDDNIVFSPSIVNASAPAVQGGSVTFTVVEDGTIFVNGAKVIFPNIILSNGVAHVIDSVLNPLVPFDTSQLDPSAPAADRVQYQDATSAASISFAATPYSTEITMGYSSTAAILTTYPPGAVPTNSTMNSTGTVSATPSASVIPATGGAGRGFGRATWTLGVAVLVACGFCALL